MPKIASMNDSAPCGSAAVDAVPAAVVVVVTAAVVAAAIVAAAIALAASYLGWRSGSLLELILLLPAVNHCETVGYSACTSCSLPVT